MSKIRYLTDLAWPGAIDLVFSVKTERDIIFRDELEALRRRHPNLRVIVTLTREAGAGVDRGARPDRHRHDGPAPPGDRLASGAHLRPDRDDRPHPGDARRAGASPTSRSAWSRSRRRAALPPPPIPRGPTPRSTSKTRSIPITTTPRSRSPFRRNPHPPRETRRCSRRRRRSGSTSTTTAGPGSAASARSD